VEHGTTRPAPDVTILGGGPAGVAVAHYAHRAGLPFRIFERGDAFGGLCRTYTWGAHRYDSGAHRFHARDADVTADVRTLLGDDLAPVDAPSQIYADGRWLDFPPRPLNWLRGRGVVETMRTVADVCATRLRPRPERSFEDRALNRYGRRLAEPLLLRYSEKLWGRPARELSPDVATKRLAGFSLATAALEVLAPERTTTHLDGSFLYPRDGYGAIVERLTQGLPAERMHPSREITGLDVAHGRIRAVRCADGATWKVGGRVVATVPLTVVARWLGDLLPARVRAAAARLTFRHVRLVVLRVATPRCTPNASIYVPDPAFAVSRISEPKNRSPRMSPPDETLLVAEVPCSDGEPLARLDPEALAERVVGELASIGLVEPAMVRDRRHHLLPNAYPVYALDYFDDVEIVRDGLAAIANLDLLGRNGRFWYSHLHDQLRLAKDYVRALPSFVEPLAAQHAGAHPEVGGEAVIRTPAA
jgi:protoporphyrinogen oxidase